MALIDIGSDCSDRAGNSTDVNGNTTWIDKTNPANDTGKITNVAIWAYVSMASAYVATFYCPDPTNFPDNFTARSASGNLGAVTSGSLQNFAVNLNVVVGDFIGIYFTDQTTAIEFSTSGGSGLWYKAADQTACVDTAFLTIAGWAMSLYGTGATPALDNAIFFGCNF